MIRRPPRSTHCISSAASDVYKRQVSGEMMMNDIAKALKVAHPERRWATREAPYWLSLVAAFFHPKIDVSWAKRHLRRKLYWDASPAERDLDMEWRNPIESILETTPPILENGWD